MPQSTDTVELQAVEVADDQTPQRNALMHALSEAEQVVSQLHTVPTDVDIRADAVTGAYSVNLYFTKNHASVMEFAQLFDADSVSSSPSTYTPGVFLEAMTRYRGTTIRAWTIVDEAPDPDGPPSDRPVDEDPIAYTLTGKADEPAEQSGPVPA